ncbi:MAG: serine/threonine-protein phosphatase [Firmicutes bacterium]|nr:serine/threonine-protein phosphatase [Bacillota bacterium]
MEIRIGIAKVGKYAVGGSGDSVEVVERPRGGMSIVIVDGQGHGRSAKRLSHQVAIKAANLIAEGARDGAVMRTASDYLYTLRDGKVSATLTVLTADLDHRVLVVSRNSNCPVIIMQIDGSSCLDSDVTPIGVHRHNRPSISHWPMYPGTMVVGFTDGVVHAGRYSGEYLFSLEEVQKIIAQHQDCPQTVADRLIDYAIQAEKGKPKDDMLVAALAVYDRDKELGIRRMMVSYPF